MTLTSNTLHLLNKLSASTNFQVTDSNRFLNPLFSQFSIAKPTLQNLTVFLVIS